jgi:hypothetical protein
MLRNDIDPPWRRGPVFIFYDQEPLNFEFNQPLFDHIRQDLKGPFILVSTERQSEEKVKICEHNGFAHIDYFFHIFAAADWYRGHGFLPRLIPPSERVLRKHYITFNRLTSNERMYRSLFVNELHTRGILDRGHVSFSVDCPDGGHFADSLRQGASKYNLDLALVESTVSNLTTLGELRIDHHGEHIPNQSMLLSPMPALMESFLFVVTETCFWQTKTHLTEKIFKPIVLRMPFVLLGCAHNLRYLHSYGFKTFGDFWDESYDHILDPVKRLQAVTNIVQDVCNQSPRELRQMLLAMSPILEHNYQRFTDPAFVNSEWAHLKESFKSIVKFYQYRPPYRLDTQTGQAIPIEL